MDDQAEIAERDVVVVPVNFAQPPVPASRLPAAFGFMLLTLISLSLHTLAFDFAGPISDYELSGITRTLNANWHPAAFLAFKVLELLLGWRLRFDYLDLAALTILTHGPYYFFLYVFYEISAATSLTYLAIDIVALAGPFALLRANSPAHNPAAPASAVPNKSIINDFSIKAVTTLLPAAIYGVVIYSSFALWLTSFLASHSSELKTFESAHNAMLPALILYAIPLGWSARTFLFSPSTAARPNLADVRQAGFNPETATLGETFAHNIWGWSLRTKVLIKRTAILLIMQGLNCWLRTFVTIEGTESTGALGWAFMWGSATLLVGFGYQWAADI